MSPVCVLAPRPPSARGARASSSCPCDSENPEVRLTCLFAARPSRDPGCSKSTWQISGAATVAPCPSVSLAPTESGHKSNLTGWVAWICGRSNEGRTTVESSRLLSKLKSMLKTESERPTVGLVHRPWDRERIHTSRQNLCLQHLSAQEISPHRNN